jgi:signal transduction histidine kinase/HAMP domain-containing protein
MSIKSKLRAGIGFLFLMALVSSGLADYYLTRLSTDSKIILKDNYRTLIYVKNIGQILDQPGANNLSSTHLKVIQDNITQEEHNITEPGEGKLADSLQATFNLFNQNLNNPSVSGALKLKMKGIMYSIMQLNMTAIERKNSVAGTTADRAIIIVSFIGSLCFLIAFSFAVNFPSYIANPVRELISGIKEIANKNYNKRLMFESKDEFGEVAEAFNQMARKLNDYETSNLASILFEKKRIETIINSMHDAIIGLDDKLFIIFANKVACDLIGMPEEKLTAQYAPNVALENDLLRNMLMNDQLKMKIYADNRESYFTKEILEVVNEGQVIGKVVNDAKTTFIATVSHELKTPISSIKMSLKLLDDSRVGEMNSEQKQLVQNIDDDAQRLLQITGELLDAAQIETGKIQLNFGSTHPKNIVNYAVQAIKSLAEQKKIFFDITCPDTLPNVMADLDKTTWVLINLLSNAIKYSPEKSTVQVNVKKKGNALEFSVKDHGRGIDTKYLPRLFERYFKVPGADAEKTGTGLGLAIAKDFIEAQGGTIGVESEIGDGSRFYFTLNINNS